MLESKVERLADVVERIGESVLATSETVETLATYIDRMGQQFAQNRSNVAVLADAVHALASGQQEILVRLDQLICVLQTLTVDDDDSEVGGAK